MTLNDRNTTVIEITRAVLSQGEPRDAAVNFDTQDRPLLRVEINSGIARFSQR